MSVPAAGPPKGSDRPPGAGAGSLKGDDMASCQVMGPAATTLNIAAPTGVPSVLDERSRPLVLRP